LLTVFAYAFVLPSRAADEEVVRAWFAVGADADARPVMHSRARETLDAYEAEADASFPGFAQALALPAPQRREQFDRFRAWYDARPGVTPLAETPRLVWSTDDNPARRVQCRLFRQWRIKTYGSAVDIITDPSNRDVTKTIVQCVAGAGPDVIEAYGPAELAQFVQAGVAMDVTDQAHAGAFGLDRVFPAAVSSIAVGDRQYAFPCNVGYVVLFYHRDLFAQAGVPEPSIHTSGWTIEQLIEAARRVMAADPTGRRVGIMGLGAWGMALSGGASFFNESGTASFFNNPRTVAALKAYQDLMYTQRVMPTPAEAASMASSGGANMNADAASASASSLFAAKVTAMVTDGRWSYVSLATRNRDRVIRPAVERRLAELSAGAAERVGGEADLLRAAIASISNDVLVPITDAQYDAMAATLTDDDRSRLIQLGVAHVPTMDGAPWYEAAARVAIVNRASPRAAHASEFLRFLASAEYNAQINHTFDSICGVPEFCLGPDGISGPPRALPGLEAFDSPVFVEAMADFAHPWELSPFIGRGRLGILVGPVLEQVTNNAIGASEAARIIEERINAQIHANLTRDAELREEWQRRTGKAFDPSRPLREQFLDAPAGGSGDASGGVS
jgi:ABC-type glycerol-3-phosphate transport system substrate-binding protein